MDQRSRAFIWALGIFVSGLLLGVLLTLILAGGRVMRPPFFAGTGGRMGPPRLERQIEQLSEHLNLDARQREQLSSILERSRDRFRNARQEQRRLQRQAREETLREIRALLRPDQLERLDEYIRRAEDRFRRRPGGAP
ncbi:MAG: hypothetical protein HY645_09150 [Acidobacteria bacterium]|nr:hypothetical protein [Acidobacteriota bacterium]